MKYATQILMTVLAAQQASACGLEDGAAEFNYNDLGDNWLVDGFHSPVCASGREQSPIDLTGGIPDDLLSFVVSEHTNYVAEDDKVLELKTHTLEMGLDSGKFDIMFPDGSADSFNTVQFHAHSPSEHTIDGAFQDLEIHFVHTHPDGDKFAVFGVFFKLGEEENDFIAQLAFEDVFDEENPLADVDVADFLESVDKSGYWHYDGSFTTPPCTEGVEWFVMKEVQTISQAQLDAFQSQEFGNADFVNNEGNNRRTQPINDRVLYSQGGAVEEAADGEMDEQAEEMGEAEEEDSHEDDCGCDGCNADITIGENAEGSVQVDDGEDTPAGANNVSININFNVDA